MDIRTDHRDGGVVVVAVDGEVDLYTADELRVALTGAVDEAALGVVLDLAEVGFLDSYGLGVVVQAFKRSRSAGRGFAIASPRSPLRRLFSLTGLDRALPLRETADDAVGALRHQTG